MNLLYRQGNGESPFCFASPDVQPVKGGFTRLIPGPAGGENQRIGIQPAKSGLVTVAGQRADGAGGCVQQMDAGVIAFSIISGPAGHKSCVSPVGCDRHLGEEPVCVQIVCFDAFHNYASCLLRYRWYQRSISSSRRSR